MVMTDKERGFYLPDAAKRDLAYVHHILKMNTGVDMQRQQEKHKNRKDSKSSALTKAQATTTVRQHHRSSSH